MNIKKIYIKSFGQLHDREFILSPGMNIIEGDNESGKSTIAAFIKFILYGMPLKAAPGRELAERRQYISWDGAYASGSLTLSLTEDDTGSESGSVRGDIQIERTLSVATDSSGRETYRESVKMTDTATNTQIHKGKCPGEVLLGVPEEVYTGTAFVRQIGGAKVDGTKLSEATENLLFSADEAVNTQKAQEKIDGVRRQLLYKNGRGGQLYDKQAKRNELTPRLEAAKKTATELIGIDSAIGELNSKRDVVISRRDAARRKNHEYDIIMTVNKFDAKAKLETELAELYAEKDRLLENGLAGGHFPDAEYTRALQSVSDEMGATSSSIAAAARLLDTLRSQMPSYDVGDTDDKNDKNYQYDDDERMTLSSGREDIANRIIDKAAMLQHRKSTFIRTAVLFSVFAVIIGALSFFLRGIDKSAGAIAAGATALFGAVFVILLIAGINARGKYKKYLSRFGAEEESELPARLSEIATGNEADAERRRRIEATETEIYVQYAVYDDEKKRAASLLSQRGVTASDDELPAVVRDTAAACAAICARDREISDEIEKRKSAVAELSGQLTEMTEEAARAEAQTIDFSAYENVTASALRLEREFNENAAMRLTESIHALEVRRAQLAASAEDPSAIAAATDKLDRDIEEDRQRYQACVLAIETMERAGRAVRDSVAPRLCASAKEYMSAITGGKYDALGVDSAFHMTVYADGASRELDYMSCGTCDAAYLSLRLALTELLYREQKPPLIFDESFSGMDDGRTYRVLSELNRAGERGIQTILLTCQKREGWLAGEISGNAVNRICL